jgi:hypothetical protein
MHGDPARLLAALLAAGCKCFVIDDDFCCSPPVHDIDWPGGSRTVDQAIDELRCELRDLVIATTATVH